MTYDKNQHLELARKNQALKFRNEIGFSNLTNERETLVKFERIISAQIHWSYRDFYALILSNFSQSKISIEHYFDVFHILHSKLATISQKVNNDPETILLFEYDSSAKDFDSIIQGLLGNCRDFEPDDLERLDWELSESQMKELAASALQQIQDYYKFVLQFGKQLECKHYCRFVYKLAYH